MIPSSQEAGRSSRPAGATPAAAGGAAPATEPPRAANAARARLGLALIGVATAVVHYGLADPRQGPRIFADEIGYLANARYLAGGGRIDMSHTAFYAGGWSLAIAPLSRVFAHNPLRLYVSVIALQAVLAGCSAVVIALVCRWLFRVGWTTAIVAAAAGVCYPAYVMNSGFAWSESMLAFALLVTIAAAAWVLHTVDARPRSRRALLVRAVATGAGAGYVVTVHNRTVVAMVALVAIVGVVLVRRRETGPAAAMAVAFVTVGGAGQMLNRILDHELWGGAGRIDAGGRATDLLHAEGFWHALRAAIGQYWYQLVATGGLIAVALAGLALLAWRRGRHDPPGGTVAEPERATFAAIVVVVFVSLLGVSAIFLANGNRADAIVYGRYLDVATPLLVALAIAWLGSRPARRSLAIAGGAVVCSAGSWLVLHFGARLELTRPYNRVTTLAVLGWLDPTSGRPMLFVATAWAVGVAGAALAISFAARRRALPGLVATAVIAAGVVSLFGWQLSFAHRTVLTGLELSAASTKATVGAVRDTGTSELTVDATITVVERLALEYWLPDVDVVPAAPARSSCSNVVSITHAATTPPGEVQLTTVGTARLLRGTRACPIAG